MHDRLIEIAAVVLEHTVHKRMLTTNLNKSLFYIDLVSIRDHGYALTGSSYVAITHGPVVKDYKNTLIKPLKDAGIAVEADDPAEPRAKPLALLTSVPANLTPQDVTTITNVTRKLEQWSAREVSEFSHENVGWMIAHAAWKKRGGSAIEINMHIAMQQILEHDPWLDEHEDETRLRELVVQAASTAWT